MINIANNNYNDNKTNFLIIRIDSIELALSTTNIDGIAEFCTEPLESQIPDILLGKYCKIEKIIPVIDIKAYLKHPNGGTLISPQTRIIFINYLKQKPTIGFVVDAILQLYRELSKNILLKSIENNTGDLKYFNVRYEIKLNGKTFPVLELEDVISFLSLKELLMLNLHPQIYNNIYLDS